MANVYFTSDLHWGHRLVAEHRGFTFAGEPDTPSHDAALEDRWRSTVRPDDQVWVLGDLAVSSPRHALEIMASLPGHKHLVWGNHDAGHPMHRSAFRQQRRYLDVFESVQASARRRIEGREVLLSHYPYSGDHTEGDRDTQWRLRDLGVPLLHGHVHSIVRVSLTGRGTLQIHIGVDAWGLAPASLEAVAGELRVSREDRNRRRVSEEIEQ